MRNLFRVFLLFLVTGGIAAGLLSCGPDASVEQPSPLPSIEATAQGGAPNATESGRYFNYIFDTVTVDQDIPFGQAIDYQGQEQTLLLDIYMPEGDTEINRPAIIFVHGGGFTEGNKDGGLEVTICEAFARKGYVCLSINYRLRNERYSDWEGTFSDAVTDAYTALAWTVKHSGDYGIDPAHIALSGYSAGAVTVTGLLYNEDIELPGTAYETVFSVINMSGGSYGLGAISPAAPPCLIVHGTKDSMVPFMGGTQCAEELSAAGVKNTFYVLDGSDHDLYPHIQEIEDVMTIFLYEMLTGSKPDIPIRKGS